MVSFSLHGIGVSGGIAIGRAQLVSHATREVAHYTVPREQVQSEIARFESAVRDVQRELEGLHAALASGDVPGEFGAFLDVHWMILNDPTLSEAPKRIIAEQCCNAEWALARQMGVLVEQFDQIEDAYLRERKADVVQVVERVLKRLMGRPGTLPVPSAEEQTIVVAHSLNVPAVVATHNARQLIRDGEMLIVDGSRSVVIVNPDRAVLAEYRLKQNEFELARQKLRRLRSKRAETLDGEHVELYANIELPEDVEPALANGASGIGLFRSEFLFLNREGLPSEDEQFEAYRKVAAGMQGKPVTIRTFDLGADKQPEEFDGLARVAPNPALGLRAVRFCLAEPRLFLTQLRAILRATHHGNVRILIPMLASVAEIDQTLALIERAKETLREQGVPFDASVKVGGMIEIPAAVLAMGAFLRKLDFLSIGTNDLIQYTLAVDRADDAVSHLYDPLHPAVLRLIGLAIGSATKARVPIAVCGEMAGDLALTRLFLGFGLREFSMHPSRLLGVKQRVLQTNVAANAPLIERIRRTDEPERLNALLAKLDA